MKKFVLFSLTVVVFSIVLILSSCRSKDPFAGKTFIQQENRGVLKEAQATNNLDAYMQKVLDNCHRYNIYAFSESKYVVVTVVTERGEKIPSTYEYEVNGDALIIKYPMGATLYKLNWLSSTLVRFTDGSNEELYALTGSADDFRTNPPSFKNRAFVTESKVENNMEYVIKFDEVGNAKVYPHDKDATDGGIENAINHEFSKDKDNTLYFGSWTIDYSWIDQNSFNARIKNKHLVKFILLK